jgi:ornithine--oxo-acid transaminase
MIDRGGIVKIIGAGCGAGARDTRCADGPEHLRRFGIASRLQAKGIEIKWGKTLHARRVHGGTTQLTSVIEFSKRLAQEVSDTIARNDFPLVLGGDHSCAIGTWNGVRAALNAPLGLIWIDAHMDAHTPETSESGALHGMPVAHLLGSGHAELANLCGISPVFRPDRVCLIGVRSFEEKEAELLSALGVRVYYMQEIRARGLAEVFSEAMEIAQQGMAGFGISLDLDALDPEDAPGTGALVASGLTRAELVDAFRLANRHPKLIALEIAEYNPVMDQENATARLAETLIAALLKPARASVKKEQRYCAGNYEPLPIVLVKGKGVYLWDEFGNRYLDMLGAYSATTFGHCHPRLTRALAEQANTLALTSRVFHSDRLGLFAERLCKLVGQDKMLPMNTGAEGVETALKAARKWAYEVKGVAPERAQIIACRSNFHGRTLGVISFSSEPQYRRGFGPFLPGVTLIPYNDVEALEAAINENTAAFLVEPIQGEGGIIVPSPGYLAACAEVCKRHRVLLIADEVQTGLGRTGRLLACEHDNVKPDALILGKALGGGLIPTSAFLARSEVMDVFTPGDHGSTFGGNPLACAVGMEALDVLEDERLIERSRELGEYFLARLKRIESPAIRDVRGKGLFIGIELDPSRAAPRVFCERLSKRGILTKDTHGVIRFAPPLVIGRAEIDWAVSEIRAALREFKREFYEAA